MALKGLMNLASRGKELIGNASETVRSAFSRNNGGDTSQSGRLSKSPAQFDRGGGLARSCDPSHLYYPD